MTEPRSNHVSMTPANLGAVAAQQIHEVSR